MKRIHLQRQQCSSPEQNIFVTSDAHVHLQCDLYLEVNSTVAETFWLLAMNAFVCSVKSYLEVSSRDFLLASDKHVVLVFGSWLEILQKNRKQQKKFLEKKFLFNGMDL